VKILKPPRTLSSGEGSHYFIYANQSDNIECPAYSTGHYAFMFPLKCSYEKSLHITVGPMPRPEIICPWNPVRQIYVWENYSAEMERTSEQFKI